MTKIKLNLTPKLPKRVLEDADRLKESSFGADDIMRWAKGDRQKPRAFRDAEKNR